MKKLFTLVVCTLLLNVSIVSAKSSDSQYSSGVAKLSFIENIGQVTDQSGSPRNDIQYKVAAHCGLSVFVGNGKLHYQFFKKQTKAEVGAIYNMYRMDVELVGANTSGQAVTGERLGYYENYYLPGIDKNDATAHTYSNLIYKNVYPNIDWTLSTQNGILKQEFIVHKGGNPGDIRIRYNGAQELFINADGALMASTPFGSITEAAPVSYQQNGINVISSYKLDGNILSYNIGQYSGELTIDPNVIWGTYLGEGSEHMRGVATQVNNAVFATGYTDNPGNIATTGAMQTSINGKADGVIFSIDQSGSRTWATYYGGSEDDFFAQIAYKNNKIYAVGSSNSTNLIANSSNRGKIDGIYLCLDASGTYKHAFFIGGSEDDVAQDIAISNTGDFFIVGYTKSDNGFGIPESAQPARAGGIDMFLQVFEDVGTSANLLYTTYFGGGGDDIAVSVILNKSEDPRIAGYTSTTASNITWNAAQSTYGGGANDVIIAGYRKDTNGDYPLNWATF